jgi:4-hydroxy-3-methylbut-2-enyl diphosphate reductase
VHAEAENHYGHGRQIILIGHAGHPEVVGTMGQLPDGVVLLVETVAQVQTVQPADPTNLAYITQTTLSVDDTAAIVEALRRRFPAIVGPRKEDICYATTNRQAAVKAVAARADAILVVGAPNSSNSMRLVEVARQAGCRRAMLIQRASDIDWAFVDGASRLGITAGASAPEDLVQDVIAACRQRYDVAIENVVLAEESVRFNLPRALAG